MCEVLQVSRSGYYGFSSFKREAIPIVFEISGFHDMKIISNKC